MLIEVLLALEHGHGDVEQEGQRDDDDADLGRQRLFEELAAHGFEDVVAGQVASVA
jgi:hypothetical protein